MICRQGKSSKYNDGLIISVQCIFYRYVYMHSIIVSNSESELLVLLALMTTTYYFVVSLLTVILLM
jgi:hypothetical protein